MIINSRISDPSGPALTKATFSAQTATGNDPALCHPFEKLDPLLPRDRRQVHNWPAWQACCSNPLQQMLNLEVDWRISADETTVAGLFAFPDHGDKSDSIVFITALFDQGLGLCGRINGCHMLLTTRLEAKAQQVPPAGANVTMFFRSTKRTERLFEARACLFDQRTIFANGRGLFRVFF